MVQIYPKSQLIITQPMFHLTVQYNKVTTYKINPQCVIKCFVDVV